MKLKDKVAIITGAGHGIGKAVAIQFAKEGAKLSLNYFGQNKNDMDLLLEELKNYGSEVIISDGDLSDENVVKSLVNHTVKTYGRIDILTNIAGICNQSLIQDLEVETWDRMLDVNLKSVFLTTKYTAPFMIVQKSGRIINFASQLAQKGGIEVSHYAASKAGVIGFTKSIALELGEHGITANCIAPGPIETQMLAKFNYSWREQKLSQLPLHRFGSVEEIVPSVVLLASDPDGNAYTGQTLGPNLGDVML
ncbi:SDR family NAD(P)-dependent oxidoreductase [Neobacillus kokaensis]|uniref:3-oxoacyl-ACP reductase n=1 Tax=Neobacillus kokaensis TaxID=2759023 RepID=A0ABQ3N3W7_9BACI|nr:3-oxoacyl-ACP reductase family protein [Neobacillus kokaensis]GHH98839.1 3-oxoacyl-ACP reductase [Neobacillus kokaensis]